jgi:hypothetical protein
MQLPLGSAQSRRGRRRRQSRRSASRAPRSGAATPAPLRRWRQQGQEPSANSLAAFVAFCIAGMLAALLDGMLVFYIARWVDETSVWLAALATTTFSGLANTAAAFCTAGLLHITSSLASTFSGIATTAAALVDTAFAAARSAAISAGFWLALAAFVSFIATFPIASTGRVAEAQPQPGGGCTKEKERQRKERQRQRKIGAGERGAAGSDGGEVCERPL